jgi:Tfp pilus assembly protein PilO
VALNKREQMLLMMVVATVIVVGNWILVVPLIQTARNRETAIAQERAKLERVRRTVEVDGPRWRAEYEQLQDSLGERASVFSTTSDVLKKVEDVGTECGLAVPVKKSLAPVERDVYRELPVQCTLEGSLEGMVRFLYTLQTASGMVSVDQIQIYPPRPSDPSQLKCDLVVVALASKSRKPSS